MFWTSALCVETSLGAEKSVFLSLQNDECYTPCVAKHVRNFERAAESAKELLKQPDQSENVGKLQCFVRSAAQMTVLATFKQTWRRGLVGRLFASHGSWKDGLSAVAKFVVKHSIMNLCVTKEMLPGTLPSLSRELRGFMDEAENEPHLEVWRKEWRKLFCPPTAHSFIDLLNAANFEGSSNYLQPFCLAVMSSGQAASRLFGTHTVGQIESELSPGALNTMFQSDLQFVTTGERYKTTERAKAKKLRLHPDT